MGYVENAAANIFPLSIEKSDLALAFMEWAYTGEAVDHGDATKDCGLCNKDGLRYHFRIKNGETETLLWVGSQCILKFDVGAFIDGEVVHGEQAKKKVRKDRSRLIEAAREERVLEALRALWLVDVGNRQKIKSMAEYIKRYGNSTPRQMGFLAWRMGLHNIAHASRDFKVAMRRTSAQDDICNMPPQRLHQLWPYLQKRQRKLVNKWRSQSWGVD